MCFDPVTAAVIAGTALTAGSQVMGGMTANAQGKYEQQVARNNAAYEREAASDATARGKQAELKKAQEVAQTRAMAIAASIANGYESDFGTAADIASDAMTMGLQDTWTIRDNAEREVRGHLIRASNFTAEGDAARARGRNARTMGFLQAGGTILSSAGSIAGMGGGASAGGQKLTMAKQGPITPIGSRDPFGGMAFG